ncbi:DNA-binding transcriptional regulator, PadR family [Ralstonia sp. 25mfcol4.1]|nr:DNA-binding transcriptional regulator, PadR family [Ralstonia sp. 25mfcol4.1]
MRHHFNRMHDHMGHAGPHSMHHGGMRAAMAMKLMGMMGGRGGGFWAQGGSGIDGDGDGFDGDNLRRGRKFSAEDLQLLLLSLLDEKPSHGYELIKALETRTGGFYKPSPGVVYPALTFLEDVGYATVDLEGNKKRYQLSEAGRAYLDQNRARLEQMVARLQHVARKMDFMRRAMSGQPQREVEEGGWAPELVQARGRLKQALMMRSGATADEQRRIAAILERAADDIEHGERSANQPE